MANFTDYAKAVTQKRRAPDPNRLAFSVVQASTGDPPVAQLTKPVRGEKKKDPPAVDVGRKGGQKCGKARAAKMSKNSAKKALEMPHSRYEQGHVKRYV
jgi:hypothetical protein